MVLRLLTCCCSRPYHSGATPAIVQPLAPRRGVGSCASRPLADHKCANGRRMKFRATLLPPEGPSSLREPLQDRLRYKLPRSTPASSALQNWRDHLCSTPTGALPALDSWQRARDEVTVTPSAHRERDWSVFLARFFGSLRCGALSRRDRDKKNGMRHVV